MTAWVILIGFGIAVVGVVTKVAVDVMSTTRSSATNAATAAARLAAAVVSLGGED